VLPYLTTEDLDQVLMLELIANRAQELALERDKRLATLIANAFVKAKLHG